MIYLRFGCNLLTICLFAFIYEQVEQNANFAKFVRLFQKSRMFVCLLFWLVRGHPNIFLRRALLKKAGHFPEIVRMLIFINIIIHNYLPKSEIFVSNYRTDIR